MPLLIIGDVGLNTLRPAADERACKPKVSNAAKAMHALPARIPDSPAENRLRCAEKARLRYGDN